MGWSSEAGGVEGAAVTRPVVDRGYNRKYLGQFVFLKIGDNFLRPQTHSAGWDNAPDHSSRRGLGLSLFLKL